jgi:predicted SAM-dependent methyltransferase
MTAAPSRARTPRGGCPTVADVRLMALPQHDAAEGLLTVAQSPDHVPFRVERCFIVQASQPETIRGHHAHRTLHQFLVSLHGHIDVLVDDGREKRTYELTSPAAGLHVPPGIWCEQSYRTAGSTLLVLCDQPFAETDYIRDYDRFLREVQAREALLQQSPLRLNLGCGGRPLAGYINVDMDSLDQIRARYPGRTYPEDLVVVDYDLLNLPFADGTVEEVRSDAMVEHLPFRDEGPFFREIVRVLKPGGLLYLTTVDFEATVRQWLAAADDWRDFYRDDDEAIRTRHWFGTYSYGAENRWGYLAATLYGSQNGAGQFHTNCYTESKLRAICARLGLNVDSVDRFRWQGDRDHMLALTARKPVSGIAS